MRTQTRTRRWQAVACGALAGLLAGTPALAVHDDGAFELDGNAVDGAAAGEDWNSVFGIVAPFPKTPVFDGFGEVFIVDTGNSDTGYQGSNKDIHDVSTWEWKPMKVTPDKDNLLNAYAVVENNGDTILYFGTDRFATNGDAALGFWFFQDEVLALPPPAPNANGAFSGNHVVGDVLVQVDYRQSNQDDQRATEVEVFEWVGSGGSHGPLDLITSGQLAGTGIVCAPGDTACATTNFAAAPAPWAYTPKAGSAGTFPAESFFEGGINITELFGGRCFASFLANSRSSHSETADLKDFALGSFNTCGSIAVTQACAAEPPDNPVLVGGASVRTRFDVVISNDGLGSAIHDIQMREDATSTAKTNCKIVSVDGGPALDIALPETADPDLDWVDVPGGSLAGGVDRTVTVQCDHTSVSLKNAVSVRAAQSPGGTRSLVDDHEMLDAQLCPVVVDPDVLVTKTCTSVTLNADLTPHVCVNVGIENTGDTQLTFVSVDDDKIGPLTPNVTVLDPGDSDSINACYDPTSADVGGTNPGDTRFVDEVAVEMLDAFGNTVLGEAMADCPLCPVCEDCPQPD